MTNFLKPTSLPGSARRNGAVTFVDGLLDLPTRASHGRRAAGWADSSTATRLDGFETVRTPSKASWATALYLFGDWFTAADVMIGSMFVWKRLWGGPPDREAEAYVDRLLARPRAMKIGTS